MADQFKYPTSADPTEAILQGNLAIEETDNELPIENADIQRLRTTQHHQSWSQHPSSFGLPPVTLVPAQGTAQPANELANSLPGANRAEDERHWIRAPLQDSERGIMNAWLRRNQPGSRHHNPSTVRNIRLPRADVDAALSDGASSSRDGPRRRQEWIDNRLIQRQLEADQDVPLMDRKFIIYDPVEDTPDDDAFFTPITVDDQEEECSICRQAFGLVEAVVRLPCRHCFHRMCIFTWLVVYQRDTCPFCRRAFSIQRMPRFVRPALSLS